MNLPLSKFRIEERVDIKPYTTFGVGGTARYFTEVDKARDAIEIVKFAKKNKIPYAIVAGGSNLVFGDDLPDMLVIKIVAPKIFTSGNETVTGARDYISEKSSEIICDAGVALMDLINFAASRGLSGVEALSGIPGSVGGAVVGNAGAYGQTISGTLKEVEFFDGRKIRQLSRDECRFSYKDSIFKRKPWVILSVRFALAPGNIEELQKKSREIIETRNKKFSPDMKCAGSFFKNILIEKIPKTSLKFLPKDRDYYGKVPAWYFLDQVGAKGMTEGGIKIADFHGNLLINVGGATFRDVSTLADKLKKLVFEKFGIDLEEEVRYITN